MTARHSPQQNIPAASTVPSIVGALDACYLAPMHATVQASRDLLRLALTFGPTCRPIALPLEAAGKIIDAASLPRAVGERSVDTRYQDLIVVP